MEQGILHDKLFKKMISLSALLLSVFLLFSIVAKIYDAQQILSHAAYPPKTLVVNADGKTKALPDVVYLSFSLTGNGYDQLSAQNDSLAKFKNFVAYLATQGVEKEDISFTPFYSPSDSAPPSPAAFKDAKTFSVEIGDADAKKLGDKVNAIFKEVARRNFMTVNTGNSCLTFEKPQQFLDPALQEALASARQKAQQLAKASGFTLGNIVSVSDNNPQLYSYNPSFVGSCTKTPLPDMEITPQELVSSLSVTFAVQ